MKIGIFDSGIGGLNVVNNIIKKSFGHDIYYFADTARLPYGEKTENQIKQYSEEITNFLIKFNIEVLIIACNTASAVSLTFLKNKYENKNLKIYGVIDKTVEKILKIGSKKALLLATTATINSEKYQKKLLNKIELLPIKAPLLVPMIENNLIETDEFNKILNSYINKNIYEVDTLILACTHYSLFKNQIKNIYPKLNIVDSSYEIAKIIKTDKNFDRKNKINLFVSGDVEDFKLKLKKIFNLENQNIIKKEW